MPKPKNLPSNELVLVDKQLVAPKEQYKNVSMNSLEKSYESQPRPKRELTEKQKENLQRLIEMNKQKALERRGIQSLPNGIPEVIPENKEVVRLTKRTYTKKEKLPEQQPELRRESTSSSNYTGAPPIHIHLPSDVISKKKPTRPKSSMKAPTSAKSQKKPARSYYSESDTKDEESDEEEEEDESEFDTDVEISKYNKKIEKRTQSLSSIEKQIQQLKQSNNPYAKHSVF
jgi:hypothetical protein